MALSRLMLKDILANLGPGIEPETVDAIRAELGQPVAAHRDNGVIVHDAYGTHVSHAIPFDQPHPEVQASAPASVPTYSSMIPVKRGWQPLTEEDIMLRKATAEAKGGSFTDADVAAINNERERTWNAQAKMSTAIPMEAMSRPAMPDVHVERVPKGTRNSRGEICIAVDPESGCSTYQCKNGHGYTDNNPVIRGCPTCWREEGSTSAGRDERDDGAIDGEDSRW